MGNSSTRLGSRLSSVSASLLESLPNAALHIVMLGLDSAGKTTVLYRLKLDQYVNTVPTIGFNCEKVKGTSGRARGISFVVWDVGGQDKLRPLWRSYTRCTDAIVFVVDSVDAERLEEARTEMFKTLKVPENSGVPVLLLANKQDLPGALEIVDLEQKLSLKELTPLGHLWDVATCCAITGDGLEESLEKLHELVLERRRQAKEQARGSSGFRDLPKSTSGRPTSGSQGGFEQKSNKQRSAFGSTTSSGSTSSTGDKG